MTPQELRTRANRFADDIIALCRSLPTDNLAQRLAGQLQDAGTSTAANYHAACRARSRAAFVAKLSIVVEEADESLYWLQRLGNAGLAGEEALAPLRREAGELVAIFVASQRTATRSWAGDRREAVNPKMNRTIGGSPNRQQSSNPPITQSAMLI